MIATKQQPSENLGDTIRHVLAIAQQKLTTQLDSAHLDCEVLLAYVLSESRTYLHTWPDQVLAHQELKDFNALIERRNKGEPVAYITGMREFWSLPLTVTPDTLIPRPETELLVETALNRIPIDKPYRIADLGTGAGAVAIAIAYERPHCNVIATDNSNKALKIAHNNATQFKLSNITFFVGNWFTPLVGELFNIIVANPPYVQEKDPYLQQGDLRFEPDSALVSGAAGMQDITEIATHASQYLKDQGWLMLEHGYDQAKTVISLFLQLGYKNVKGFTDQAGHDRVVIGQYFSKK